MNNSKYSQQIGNMFFKSKQKNIFWPTKPLRLPLNSQQSLLNLSLELVESAQTYYKGIILFLENQI